jgi:hypothetical protein
MLSQYSDQAVIWVTGIRFPCSGPRPASYLVDTDALSPGVSSRDMKLTTHFYLVPRMRMYGDVTSLSQYIFLVWYLLRHRDNFTFTYFFEWREGILEYV